MPRIPSLFRRLRAPFVACVLSFAALGCAQLEPQPEPDVRYVTPMREGQEAEIELYVKPSDGPESKHRLRVAGGDVLAVEVWRFIEEDGRLTGEEALLGIFPMTRELAMTLDYALHRRRHPFPPVRFDGHVETVRIEWIIDGSVVERELLGYDGGAGAFDEFGVDLWQLIEFADVQSDAGLDREATASSE